MGRQTKQGIDYFSLDTGFDDKTEMYLAECEGYGLAVLVTALQLIYANEGYYAQNGEDFCYLIKRRISGDINTIKCCLESCLRRNLFDKSLHEKYGILTSAGIQKRYFGAAKKKKEINVIPEFLLISIDSIGNAIKVGIKPISDSGNATKVKVKEEVKVKEKEDIHVAPSELTCEWFQDFWECYPPRNGKKLYRTETLSRFSKLSQPDQELCIQAVKHYASSDLVRRGMGIKDPPRFIRDGKGQEPWRDWVEPEIQTLPQNSKVQRIHAVYQQTLSRVEDD